MGRRTRLKPAPTKPPFSPVEVKRLGLLALDPTVREAAMVLAHGDVSRIEVKSRTCVVVR